MASVVVVGCSGPAVPDDAAGLDGLLPGVDAGGGGDGRIESLEDLETACQMLFACNGTGFIPMGDCAVAGRVLPEYMDCLARARGDCDAAAACFGTTAADPSDICDTCVGNTVISCFSYRARRECDARVSTCTMGTSSASCEWTCEADFCVGDDLASCSSHVVVRCPDGAPCTTGSDGARCSFPEPVSCSGSECDGDILRGCPAGLTEPPIDCRNWGGRCGYEGGSARCIGDGDPCDFGRTNAECDGETLVYCGQDERLHRYDCTGHGFLGCGLDSRDDGPECVGHGTLIAR